MPLAATLFFTKIESLFPPMNLKKNLLAAQNSGKKAVGIMAMRR